MRFRTTLATLAVLIAAGSHIVEHSLLAQSRPTAPVSIRLYVFDGGTLESDPARYQLTKEDVGVTQLSVAAFLIVHPKGLLMWDTAAVPDSEWTPTGSPVRQRLILSDGQERFVTLARPLAAQLQAAGYKPADITYLALSHYHWDHTANAGLFAGATWLVRQIERDAMFTDKPGGTSRPGTYAALKNSKTVIVTADEHDVFGDGTVILKAAAGHTPGHQVLYVNLPETGPVCTVGRPVSLSGGAHEGALSDLRVQPGSDASIARRARSVHDEDEGALVDPARLHCPRRVEEGAGVLQIVSGLWTLVQLAAYCRLPTASSATYPPRRSTCARSRLWTFVPAGFRPP